MKLGFFRNAKRGKYYDLAEFAIHKLRTANLSLKGKSKNNFEHSIVSHLQASPTLRLKVIPQIALKKDETISNASFFGFKHWPDASICKGGTAIAIKIISTGQDVNDILGQAMAYRMHYRFVIIVLVDQTKHRRVVRFCKSSKSSGSIFLNKIADEMSIFTVVGPLDPSKNKVFF